MVHARDGGIARLGMGNMDRERLKIEKRSQGDPFAGVSLGRDADLSKINWYSEWWTIDNIKLKDTR